MSLSMSSDICSSLWTIGAETPQPIERKAIVAEICVGSTSDPFALPADGQYVFIKKYFA